MAHTEIDYGDGKRAVTMITLNENSDDASFQQALSFFANLRKKGKRSGKPQKLDDVKSFFEAKIGQVIDIG